MLSRPFTRLAVVMGLVLGLSACAGGANLYAGPVADFESAVQDTGAAMNAFAALQRHQNEALKVRQAVAQNIVPSYQSTACAADKPVTHCVVALDVSTDAVPPPVDDFGPERTMWAKLADYARTLAKIADIAGAAEVKRRQKDAQAAYVGLAGGVKAAARGDAGTAEDTLKGALETGLGSLYLENKRTELLHKLVAAADPLVAQACDTLSDLLESRRRQYILAARTRVATLVNAYGALNRAHDDDATAEGRAATQRRLLTQARDVAARLRTVIAADPGEAFARMKRAHGELAAALALADSDVGRLLTAMENFTDASRRLQRTYVTSRNLL